MSFITPLLALGGLIGISIPIIIHLLSRRRRKPVEWAAMRFLLEAYRKHKRRLQVQQFILLAVRCLIVGLIGAALARPVLERTGLVDLGGSRVIVLVIDDGVASSLLDDEERSALDHSVEQAVEIIEALDAGDAVSVVTAARPARAILVPPSTNHGAVIDLLRGMVPSEAATDLPAALELAYASIAELDGDAGHVLVYLLSEFRVGSAELEAPLSLSFENVAERVSLYASVPAEQSADNVQVAAIEPVRSVLVAGQQDGSGQMTVRLVRSGTILDADVTRVTLTTDASSSARQQVVQWEPGDRAIAVEFMLDEMAGGQGEIGVTARIDDDRLRADNVRHTVLEMRERIRVLLVDRRSFGFEPTIDLLSAGQWLRRAIEPIAEGSPLEIVEVEPGVLDVPDVRTADVAVVARPDLLTDRGWAALREFVNADGLVVVVPPGEANVHRWSETMVKALRLPWRLELEVETAPTGILLSDEQPSSELLRLLSSELNELCIPVRIDRFVPIDETATRAERVLLFSDGRAAMIAGGPEFEAGSGDGQRIARGFVVFLAMAPQLDWTNLPGQPLMVPLVHEVIRQGMGLTRGGKTYRVGERPALAAILTARSLTDQAGETVALDAQQRPEGLLSRAGLYTVRDGAGQGLGTVAVNVDALASRVDAQSVAAVQQWLSTSGEWVSLAPAEIGSVLNAARSRSPIAFYVLVALLALVVLETALARWFSYARQGSGTILSSGSSGSGHRRPIIGGAA